ncbi:MAG: hypothetical protein QNJ38_10430 [Prochloraceae cyanobacterium]|nr:hypothetical protein [Prochloraceae cyanobacterium]
MTNLKQSYQTDQQVKYLHLQAEVEILLQHLKTVKQQQSAVTVTNLESN